MSQTMTLTDYDANWIDFDQFRQPNKTILNTLETTFSSPMGQILSIGCGTGQYEARLSKIKPIVGLDKSRNMISKARERIPFAILGDMIRLPFADRQFSGAYFIQSLHHVGANLNIGQSERESARLQALEEAARVIDEGPILIVQRDPSQNQAVWFWKYFPKALEVKLQIQPKVSKVMQWLEHIDLREINAIPVYDPLARGFYDPSSPLHPGFRRSFSEFSYLSKEEIQKGLENLRMAIQDQTVEEEIEKCKKRFSELGGTVYIISGIKH